jgi:hypothetical protein
MATTATSVEGAPSTWRRITSWLERWAEALEFDISEYHERRIARLELEVAALRGKSAVPGEGASLPPQAGKEVL